MFDENLESFKNFVWNKKDDIGTGATSSVYRGISLDTFQYVAVKVFNDAAKARSITLQSRELDLLRKIKHENVVKLIDKDDQIVCNNYYLKLLVMEYCNGGSLSSIIEQPENIYGLQQTEFLLVLKHITSGMNELHNLKIVHRDIKPNNILLQVLPTGEHIYKLSDFGAAREYQGEDEQFTSLCGTEEYLFPDVYERALIDRTVQKSFKAGIDLWSTGVTLYHVATGSLPFRPIGGRNNKEIMIKITKDKPSGAISGIQTQLNTILYGYELPSTCQLSKKLQQLLVPMLAGLMENNYDRMWSFQKFFEHSSYICDLTFVSVMNLNGGDMIDLAFEKHQKLNDLKMKIETETKIEKNSQIIIYNNLFFDSLVMDQQTIETYPLINKENPLILFSLHGTISSDNLKIFCTIPELRWSKMMPQKSNEITSWSKEVCGNICLIKREIYLLAKLVEQLKLTAVAFKSYMPELKLKQQSLLYNFKSTIKSLDAKLNIMDKFKLYINKPQEFKLGPNNYDELKAEVKRLESEIYIYENELNFLNEEIKCTENMEMLQGNTAQTAVWVKEIDAYVQTCKQFYQELAQQRKQLTIRLEHEKFERSRFTEFKIKQILRSKEEAKKLLEETVVVKFLDFFIRFEKWMSDLIKTHNDLMSIQEKLCQFEKYLNAPINPIESQIDLYINGAIDFLVMNKYQMFTEKSLEMSNDDSAHFHDYIDTQSVTTSKTNERDFSNNSKYTGAWDSFVTNIKGFKTQVAEIEKDLDENFALLKFLEESFDKSNKIKIVDAKKSAKS